MSMMVMTRMMQIITAVMLRVMMLLTIVARLMQIITTGLGMLDCSQG